MNKRIILLLLVTFASLQIFGQHICGNKFDISEDDRLVRNIKHSKTMNSQSRETVYIPLQLHLGSRSDGSDQIKEEKAIENICDLNVFMEEVDIQFFLTEELSYFSSNIAFNHNSGSGLAGSIMNQNRTANAVNVYVVGDLGGNVAAYYAPSWDHIVISQRFMVSGNTTLAHEIGHFFSLAHTFSGWEGETIEEGVPAPNSLPFGVLVEYVDREVNCEVAGDRICDTPADYASDPLGGNSCNFTRNFLDPDSTQLVPDVSNHMSYFEVSGCPKYDFSPQQRDVILADLDTRGNLNSIPSPGLESVESTPVMVSPEDGEQLDVYDDILLEWEPVENATRYVVIVSFNSQFFAETAKMYVTSPSATITNLKKDKKYYWKVRAFNEQDFCGNPFSDRQDFRTGLMTTATSDLEISSFRLYPNPGQSNATIYLDVSDSNSSKVEKLRLSDIQGRIIDLDPKPDNGVIAINTKGFNPGIYFLSISTENNTYVEKVIIK